VSVFHASCPPQACRSRHDTCRPDTSFPAPHGTVAQPRSLALSLWMVTGTVAPESVHLGPPVHAAMHVLLELPSCPVPGVTRTCRSSREIGAQRPVHHGAQSTLDRAACTTSSCLARVAAPVGARIAAYIAGPARRCRRAARRCRRAERGAMPGTPVVVGPRGRCRSSVGPVLPSAGIVRAACSPPLSDITIIERPRTLAHVILLIALQIETARFDGRRGGVGARVPCRSHLAVI